MSSQGKLYERISQRIAWLNDRVGKDNPPCADLRIYELEKQAAILDEAAEEFLGFVYDVDQQFVLDWFIKWFGFYFQPSMPQVVGGCAGHIDLSKLQDIEKQEP
jgi:hypothetical protein